MVWSWGWGLFFFRIFSGGVFFLYRFYGCFASFLCLFCFVLSFGFSFSLVLVLVWFGFGPGFCVGFGFESDWFMFGFLYIDY